MKNAYIKFHTEEDCAAGCEKLIARAPVSRLTGGVFCVPWGSLPILDEDGVCYSLASEADLAHAQPVWNFAAPRTS